MKRLWISVILLLLVLAARAQDTRYEDTSSWTVHGKALQTGRAYSRIDTLRFRMPASVLGMCEHSTGLYLTFRTDSRNLRARWMTAGGGVGTNMTAIAARGLELYIQKDGKWIFAGTGAPTIDGKNTTHSANLVLGMGEGEKQCLLYLPLWVRLDSLSIGVDTNSYLTETENPFRHKIIVHGSSITHGASASRAGMSYPSILARQTGMDFINLGFSGQCTMQREFAEYLSQVEADCFVFDTFSNPGAEGIRERFDTFVDIIRRTHPQTPLIFLQTLRREGRNFNQDIELFELRKTDAAREVVQRRMKTDANLYFIDPGNWTGTDHLGSQDGTHPTDLGFHRMVEIMRPEILRILKAYGIE